MVAYNTTPLSVDLYGRVMASSFNEKDIVGVPTGFQVFFGQPEGNSQTIFSPDSNDVDIDIIRANERTAVLVPRSIRGRTLGDTQKDANNQRFTNINRVFPLSIEESDFAAGQLLNRQMGENPYATRTRRERLQALAVDAHREQVRREVRLFERLAALSILTGKMPAILGTSDSTLEYDFLRNSTHSVTLGTQWSNIAADALGDIDDSWDLIREDAHVSADMMLAGEGAFEAFLLNTAVLAKADNRRFEMVMVNQNMPVPEKFSRFIEAGMTARGRLRTPRGHEIWMFTYSDVYTASGGTATKYMDDDKVLICYSQARADRYFGPPELLPQVEQRTQLYQQLFGFDITTPNMPPNVKGGSRVIQPGMFYFDAYANAEWTNATTRCQTAPIFATTQTDAYVVIENAI